MITASFPSGSRRAYTEAVYQHDKGQYLAFQGIEVLAGKEVHFSNTKDGGISVAVNLQNGKARIPDALLETGDYIYAWLYAREIKSSSGGDLEYHLDPEDPEQDSMIVDSLPHKSSSIETAQTLYEVIIPVSRRPAILRPSDNSEDKETTPIEDLASMFENYTIDGENFIFLKN